MSLPGRRRATVTSLIVSVCFGARASHWHARSPGLPSPAARAAPGGCWLKYESRVLVNYHRRRSRDLKMIRHGHRLGPRVSLVTGIGSAPGPQFTDVDILFYFLRHARVFSLLPFPADSRSCLSLRSFGSSSLPLFLSPPLIVSPFLSCLYLFESVRTSQAVNLLKSMYMYNIVMLMNFLCAHRKPECKLKQGSSK